MSYFIFNFKEILIDFFTNPLSIILSVSLFFFIFSYFLNKLLSIVGKKDQKLLILSAPLGIFYNIKSYKSLFGFRIRDIPQLKNSLRNNHHIINRETALVTLNNYRNSNIGLSQVSENLKLNQLLLIFENSLKHPEILKEELGENIFLNNLTAGFKQLYDILVNELGIPRNKIYGLNLTQAWNTSYIVFLSRVSYGLGYIRKKEALAFIRQASEEVKDIYDGWEQYIISFLFRQVYLTPANIHSSAYIASRLLVNKNSILRKNNFAK